MPCVSFFIFHISSSQIRCRIHPCCSRKKNKEEVKGMRSVRPAAYIVLNRMIVLPIKRSSPYNTQLKFVYSPTIVDFRPFIIELFCGALCPLLTPIYITAMLSFSKSESMFVPHQTILLCLFFRSSKFVSSFVSGPGLA